MRHSSRSRESHGSRAVRTLGALYGDHMDWELRVLRYWAISVLAVTLVPQTVVGVVVGISSLFSPTAPYMPGALLWFIIVAAPIALVFAVLATMGSVFAVYQLKLGAPDRRRLRWTGYLAFLMMAFALVAIIGGLLAPTATTSLALLATLASVLAVGSAIHLQRLDRRYTLPGQTHA